MMQLLAVVRPPVVSLSQTDGGGNGRINSPSIVIILFQAQRCINHISYSSLVSYGGLISYNGYVGYDTS